MKGKSMKNIRKFRYVLTINALLIILIGAAPMFASAKSQASLDPKTRFYVPPPNPGAKEQIANLTSSGNKQDADLIKTMIETPQAVWFTQGTPKSVEQDVRNTVKRAAAKKTVPVLVAYNIPFRDCAQFSAGGATTVQEYKDWIDGFAAGIGKEKAIVILEPDGLGIIPWYKPFRGTSAQAADYEWCRPAEANEATAADERFEMLNYAVDALKAKPNVAAYLDGTHSGWLNVGDAAHRLIQAGIADADGFYLNVSNYHFTGNLIQYGTWISSCIALWPNASTFVDCPNQYWNGGPLPSLVAQTVGEWQGIALDHFGQWSDTDTTVVGTPPDNDFMPLNTSAINLRYANMLGTTQPMTHFVIDTSRNGVGPWRPPAGVYPDPQDWCNPPDRGLGLRPTANTGIALLDAYLWVKIPGESDGECTRGLGPAGTTVDPEWQRIDPGAGQWFPEMALDLVHNANPPLP
jgi:endoglucanase